MNNPSINPTGGTNSYTPVGSRKQSDTQTNKRDFKKILDSDPDEGNDQAGEAVKSSSSDNGQAFEETIGLKKQSNIGQASTPFSLLSHTEAKTTLSNRLSVPRPPVEQPKATPASLAAVAGKAKQPENVIVTDSPINVEDTEEADDIFQNSQIVESEEVEVQEKEKFEELDILQNEELESDFTRSDITKTDISETGIAETEVESLNKDHLLRNVPPSKLTQEEISFEKPITKSKEEPIHTEFVREQPDLSYVNPLGVNLQQISTSFVDSKNTPLLPATDLQSLVQQMTKELSVLKQGDKTETSIVLNYPPQFDGVRISMTTFEGSPNEFNLKFENLSSTAKTILDQQQNRADLLSNLERKGYNVHIFITTTYTETTPLTINAEGPTREGKRENERGSQERQRRSDKET